MNKKLLVSVIVVLILSTTIIPLGLCQTTEVVGSVSFDTTQVFVRLAGPFSQPQTSFPGTISESIQIPISLDGNGDLVKDDWRSGKPPIECFPDQYVYAHLFLNVMEEQIVSYNASINGGGLDLPFRWDVSGLEMLKPVRFLPATTMPLCQPVAIPNPTFVPGKLIVPLTNLSLIPRTTYYLGVIEFVVNYIDRCGGVVRQVRDEIQPVDPVLSDKPDRISDMVVRLVPPDSPQLVYEDMTKLHLVNLCLSDPTFAAEGTIYASMSDIVIPIDTLKNHFGWDFANPYINVPLSGVENRIYGYRAASLYPFPPFKSYAKLPFTAGSNEWVPNFFSNNEIESQVQVKFIDGDGLHVSYVLIDKTNSLSIGKVVTVMLSFSLPSHSLPNEPLNPPTPLQFVDKFGNILN